MPLSLTGWEGERGSDDAQVRRPARMVRQQLPEFPCRNGKDGSAGLPDI